MGPRHKREVVIDALADGARRHPDCAVVCIDVLMSSSTLVTAVAAHRRVAAASTLEKGRERAVHFGDEAFLLNESEPPIQLPGLVRTGPARLEARADVRPFVLVSPSVEVLEKAAGSPAVYVACLRNLSATVDALAESHDQVALVGAGHGTDTRCEDQLVASWMARQLVAMGYEPAGHQTVREMDRWAFADLKVVALGRGAEHWRRQGHAADVDFVLRRVDDLDVVCLYDQGEVRSPARRVAAVAPVRALVASH